jgi:hypothetical protein
MDSSKIWPNNVLTTEEYIMSRYPPFHTSLKIFNYDLEEQEEETKGTILHSLIFLSLSNEMICWMICYYRACLSVRNNIEFTPLQETIAFATSNQYAFLVRLMLKYTPNEIRRKGIFDEFRWNPKEPHQTIDIMHALLDYSTEADVCEMLDSYGPDHGFPERVTLLLDARRQCKLVAAIIQKRRVICGNKDVSWLVSRYILATRMDGAWIKELAL